MINKCIPALASMHLPPNLNNPPTSCLVWQTNKQTNKSWLCFSPGISWSSNVSFLPSSAGQVDQWTRCFVSTTRGKVVAFVHKTMANTIGRINSTILHCQFANTNRKTLAIVHKTMTNTVGRIHSTILRWHFANTNTNKLAIVHLTTFILCFYTFQAMWPTQRWLEREGRSDTCQKILVLKT